MNEVAMIDGANIRTGERRKSNRLKLRDDSFAVLKFESPIIGKINDINKGGASILYFQSNSLSDEKPFIDIFTSDNSFVLQHIPFRTISDSKIDLQFDLGRASLRKKGVMFCGLDAFQKEELKFFIRTYTVDLSPNVVDIKFSQGISKSLPDAVNASASM
jgi:hypothetical protein